AIVIERRRDVEIADLLAVLVTHDVADTAVVHALRTIFGVPHELVDEVAEVQHEVEALARRCALVFVDHAAPGVLRALIHVLAAHESEGNGARIAWRGSGDRATNATGEAVRVDEAIPVLARGLEPAHQHAAGEIGVRARDGLRVRDHVLEAGVVRDFDEQRHFGLAGERPARPQHDAVGLRIAGGDALRIEIASLGGSDARAAGVRTRTGNNNTHSGGNGEKLATIDAVHDLTSSRD